MVKVQKNATIDLNETMAKNPELISFIRVKVDASDGYVYLSDEKEAKQCLLEARDIRRKYAFPMPQPTAMISSESTLSLIFKQNDRGIFEVYVSNNSGESEQSETDTSQSTDTNLFPVADWDAFSRDYERCRSIVKDNKKVNTFSAKRLTILEYMFDAHILLNSEAENESNRTDTRDFYSIAKVDNHVHLTAAVAPKDLLNFIRNKILDNDSVPVLRGLPLSHYCAEAKLTADNVNIDRLTVQGDVTIFGKHFSYV